MRENVCNTKRDKSNFVLLETTKQQKHHNNYSDQCFLHVTAHNKQTKKKQHYYNKRAQRALERSPESEDF